MFKISETPIIWYWRAGSPERSQRQRKGRPKLDAEFEQITEGEKLTKKEELKTKWAARQALVRDPKRIALVAADLVAHLTPSLPPRGRPAAHALHGLSCTLWRARLTGPGGSREAVLQQAELLCVEWV